MKKLYMLPIRAIVYGYATEKLWDSYRNGNHEFYDNSLPSNLPEPTKFYDNSLPSNLPEPTKFYANSLPDDLPESAELPHPIFMPTTKAPSGQPDEILSFEAMIHTIRSYNGFPTEDLPVHLCNWVYENSAQLCKQIRDYSLELYSFAHAYALKRGLILAKTKFEFGLDDNCNLLLGDSCLTPDTSLYWSRNSHVAGRPQPNFHNQFIQDYLKGHPCATDLPNDIIQQTRKRYRECFDLLKKEL